MKFIAKEACCVNGTYRAAGVEFSEDWTGPVPHYLEKVEEPKVEAKAPAKKGAAKTDEDL